MRERTSRKRGIADSRSLHNSLAADRCSTSGATRISMLSGFQRERALWPPEALPSTHRAAVAPFVVTPLKPTFGDGATYAKL